MSRLGVSLRIARRDARRAKGRSALVIAMIALPVLGVGAADVLYRTFELSPEQQATRTMGAADLVAEDSGMSRVQQGPAIDVVVDSPPRVGPPPDPSSVLPAGTRALSYRTARGDAVVDGRRTLTDLRELDLTDPLAEGLFVPRSGVLSPGSDGVVLTEWLATRLGAGVGDAVTLDPRTGPLLQRTVVGTVSSTSSNRSEVAFVGAGALASLGTGLQAGQASQSWLIDLPDVPLHWSHVQQLNAIGLSAQPRTPEIAGAPAVQDFGDGGSSELDVAAVIALVVGMALLEVVLLAGPAFAVGTKRQSRDLALIAASGGDRVDVRRTVLAGGVVLGGVGGVVGAVAAIGVGALAVPLLVRVSGDLPGPFDIRPLELLLIAAVGVVTAVLAALLPARQASRQDPVAALTGRRGALRSSRTVPVVGLVVAVVGALVALHGARTRQLTVVLAGSALAELGLVATTPTLVGLAGRLGPLLPVAPRLALRDASRNRGRTAPAVAAILAAVAGSVAVGTYVASLDRHDEQAYTASAPAGTVVIQAYDGPDRRALPAVEAATRAELPGHRVVRLRGLDTIAPDGRSLGFVDVEEAPEHMCPAYRPGVAPEDRERLARTDERCTAYLPSAQVAPTTLVGDAATVELATGHADPAYARVLAAGGVVAPFRGVRSDGTVVIAVQPESGPDGVVDEALIRRVTLPAVALPRAGFQTTVLSPQAAAALGLGTPVDVGVIAGGPAPTAAQEDRLRSAVRDAGLAAEPYVERGYTSDYGIGLLALVIGSAVIVLGASGIATGLAAADARADLATLAAVGATPGLRRRLAAFQSAVTAGLGTLLGVLAGLVPAIGLIVAVNRPPPGAPAGFERSDPFEIVLPWSSLAVTGIVVPLLAALAAAALTRSRLPMVRRLA